MQQSLEQEKMDIILVSGTESLLGGQANDLHIKLSRYPQLPQPYAARPWKTGPVSSLRDRLMIEWIFSHREAMKTLRDITKHIESELTAKTSRRPSDRTSSTRSMTLIVCISCMTGTCLSPAFVERLYDHYSAFPPSSTNKIIRNHLNVDSVPQKPDDVYQWQQLPCGLRFIRRRNEEETLQQIKFLTSSKEWAPIPLPLSIQLEEAYCKNPLNSNVLIKPQGPPSLLDQGVQVDFVDGTMYNKSTGQKSFLRCANLKSQAIVRVRELTHEDYRACCKRYHAAGILPYSLHPVTGEAIFLVGRLTYDGGSWCDFGGLKSRHRFRETAAMTAARECYEETLGVLGSSSHLLNTLRNYIANNAFKVVNETTDYIGHFVYIPYNCYAAQFAALAMELVANDKELEVNAMGWLPLSAVRRAVELTLAGNKVIETYAINERHGSYDNSSIRLRIEFAWSLCIADKLGILDSIEHITSEIRTRPDQELKKETEINSLLVKPMAGISLECQSNDDGDCQQDNTLTDTCEHISDTPSTTGSGNVATGSESVATGSESVATGSTGPSKRKKSDKGHIHKLYGMGAGCFLMKSHSDI